MVLKTNTRNSLVDDVYDVLISVCLVQQRSKLVLPGLKVYGGCFRGHRDARSKSERTYPGYDAGISRRNFAFPFNTIMLHVMKITQTD
jgi:hypothetical protein